LRPPRLIVKHRGRSGLTDIGINVFREIPRKRGYMQRLYSREDREMWRRFTAIAFLLALLTLTACGSSVFQSLPRERELIENYALDDGVRCTSPEMADGNLKTGGKCVFLDYEEALYRFMHSLRLSGLWKADQDALAEELRSGRLTDAHQVQEWLFRTREIGSVLNQRFFLLRETYAASIILPEPKSISRIVIYGHGLADFSVLWNDQRVLFGVDWSFQDDLDSGAIPDGLRQEFEANSAPLSQDAAVSVEEGDSAWRIADRDKAYAVRREGDELSIYDESAWSLIKGFDDNTMEKIVINRSVVTDAIRIEVEGKSRISIFDWRDAAKREAELPQIREIELYVPR
jgi:hypothetical protein